jgi:biotin carboxyl carrier protein
LDKKYFSEDKYVNSLLRINNIEKKSDIKQFIEKMQFIVVDINSINPNSFSLIPYDPRNRLFLIQRNINKTIENGTITIGKFFTNIHYETPRASEAITIVGKTIPVFNGKDKTFILRRFDIVTFELITNSAFYSILNHNNLGKYYIDVRSHKFDISDYRNFFTTNQKNFIHHKQKAIEIYNKEKDMYATNDSKSFIDIYDVISPETCHIDEIYIGLNDVVKVGDKLCKIISYNHDDSKTKFIIKSNVDGLITKIDIICGKDVKKGRTIMNILRY